MKALYSLILSFFVSLVVCGVLIRLAREKGIYDEAEGVQKFHVGEVPRIGGLAIFASMMVVCLLYFASGKPFAGEYGRVVFAGIPVFVAGFLEDIRKNVSPKSRLMASFVSGMLACALLPVELRRVGISLLDPLFASGLFSFAFTAFAIAGVSQAFNIIDGFNGLCSGVALITFATYAVVAYLVNHSGGLFLSLSAFFAVLGFFVWNYPWGSIFLGDGGAYFLGYLVAVVGLLLVSKANLSPWFVMMVVIYPVWETVFSMFRKRFLRGMSPFVPDGLHFHMLIYKRIVKHVFCAEGNPVRKNSFTSPYLWIMHFAAALWAFFFRRNTRMLVLGVFIFIAFYVWLYLRLISFNTPNFLKKVWRTA